MNADGQKLKDYNYHFVHFDEVYLFTIQFNCHLIIIITGTIKNRSRSVFATVSQHCNGTISLVNEAK